MWVNEALLMHTPTCQVNYLACHFLLPVSASVRVAVVCRMLPRAGCLAHVCDSYPSSSVRVFSPFCSCERFPRCMGGGVHGGRRPPRVLAEA